MSAAPPATPPLSATSSTEGPGEVLRLREAIAIIVGVVIGAGIFKAPSLVAGMTGDVSWMFIAWVLGGLASLVGALCYAELATTYPHAGGDYHYLQRAYGRSMSLLFGWARLSVITTGSIALLAFVFGDYMTAVLPLPYLSATGSSAAYAAASVLVLSHIHLRGVKAMSSTQVWLTALEILGLGLIIVAAITLPDGGAAAQQAAPGAAHTPSLAMFGLAMVFVLLAYGGWNEAAYISADVRDKRRNTVKALVLSIVIITSLYLAVVWAYWQGLGLEGMAKSNAVAADLLKVSFGPTGELIISLMVAVAALTSINATMIVGARTSYALGRDWHALRWLADWDSQRGAPLHALRLQCVVALALIVIGTWAGGGFKAMVEFTAPVFWLFFLLSGISLFVLRIREPHAERPFKVPLYPVLPAVFCLVCAYMLWSALSYVNSQTLGGWNAAWISVAVLGVGVVLVALMRKPSAVPAPAAE
jgi:basic amino acid/polyamine antiporter, APA family